VVYDCNHCRIWAISGSRSRAVMEEAYIVEEFHSHTLRRQPFSPIRSGGTDETCRRLHHWPIFAQPVNGSADPRNWHKMPLGS
jgi:hypothetical protein